MAAQRVLEMLNDHRLTPGQLIGLLQQENQREQIELAKRQFDDRLKIRLDQERREERQKEREHEMQICIARKTYPGLDEALQKRPGGPDPASSPVEPHTTR